MSELEQLTEAFLRMGANRTQADTMASQMLKRAGQIAVERGISPAEALAGLLQRVMQARAGDGPFQSPP